MRATPALPDPRPLPPGACIGIDLVRVERIARSMADFGERFARRLFAPGELRAATVAGRLDAGELAMRFAAKEAAIKAFGWSEASIDWRDIEVVRADTGACHLELHGHAAELLAAWGPAQIALSLSHDGNYAVAVVTALPSSPSFPDTHHDHRRH